MSDTFCERCGQILKMGDYPFCPHGTGINARGRDEIPGGVWLENYGPEPIKVYSHSERRAIMKARGLEEMVRHVGVPGTDKSPHTTDFSRGSIDAKTLDNARVLVSRGQREEREDEDAFPTFIGRPIHATGDRDDVKVVLEAARDSLINERDIVDAEQMLETIRQMEEEEKESDDEPTVDA